MRFIFGLFWCCFWWNSSAYSMRKITLGVGEPNSPITDNVMNTEDKWFMQKLDHFNPTDNRIWKQRYHVNMEYYKNGGPVFLMIGGESSISKRWMHSGEWIEYAQEFNALCFNLEHRYYGESRPTEDMSTKNLRYLSSEQALADLSNFIVNIRTKYGIATTTKWVAFGGSYAGSLAAWLRMKYPHLVHIVVSASGPLLAKVNFKEYFKVVEHSLATYNPDCVCQIKKANQIINGLIRTRFGAKIIERKFKLCKPLNIYNKKDISTLFESLADNFAVVVQYNKDNRYYSNPEQKVTLEALCDIMVDKSLLTPLSRYAAVNAKLLSIYGSNCLDHIYTHVIGYYSNTSWNSNASFGGQQWTYQTCTEFGFYQTSEQSNHVFGHNFPIEYFIDMCSDIFGKSYNSKLLFKAVERTNIMYGELNIREGRVIFVHGSVDPWHALGVIKPRTKNTTAIFINGTAHCANMYPSAPTDLPQLTSARTTIRTYLNKWLMESDFIDTF